MSPGEIHEHVFHADAEFGVQSLRERLEELGLERLEIGEAIRTHKNYYINKSLYSRAPPARLMAPSRSVDATPGGGSLQVLEIGPQELDGGDDQKRLTLFQR